MHTIKDRMQAVVESEIAEQRRFKSLEEATQIDADRWKAVWHNRQRPTADMVEQVGRLWPDYAYWLVTGLTEPALGHCAPASYQPIFPVRRGTPDPARTTYRNQAVALLRARPTEESELAAYKAELEDTAYKLREKHLTPGAYMNFQRVMRALKEPPDEQFVALELDPAIADLEYDADQATLRTLQEINTHRAHTRQNEMVKSATKAIGTAFRRLLRVQEKP